MWTCENCGFESSYADEVARYDSEGFELNENQDDCAAILCRECAND